jgi:hypothetical protein
VRFRQPLDEFLLGHAPGAIPERNSACQVGPRAAMVAALELWYFERAMTRSTLPCLIATLLLTACASKEFNEPGEISVTEHTPKRAFSGSYGDVWRAATGALAVKRYAIASSQREAGFITTDWIIGKSDRLYSGYGDTRIPYNIRFRFTIRVQPTRSGVTVNVKSEEQYMTDSVTAGSDFSGSLYQWVPTDSSTAKERNYLDEVESQLAAVKAPPR